MIPILSRAQIRSYDEEAIRRGVPSLVLMENAGRGAAEIAAGLVSRGAVVIVCGRGNNGGDGFVVARHLRTRGIAVRCFVIGARDQVGGDARANLEAFLGLGGNVVFGDPGATLGEALDRAELAVDALFGTGLTRPVEGVFRDAVERLNRCEATRLALDIPSGIDADTGAVLGVAVRADHTATFAHRKCGLMQGAGAIHAGRLHLVDLGIFDDAVVAAVGATAHLVDGDEVASVLGVRAPDLHKYGAGSVLIAAGSPGKVGAAWLAALGALRAGAGLVTIATWREAADRLEGRLPEAMTLRLDDAPEQTLQDALVRCKAAGVGPGFGLDGRARAAVEVMAHSFAGPLVLDADAITAFAGRPQALRQGTGPRILTPHAGELGRLLGISSAEVEAHRFEAARRAAAETGATVVLKGWRTVIAGAEGLAVCDRGDPVLATGGSGDVLTGIVTALACVASPFEAACAGVYLHACAGERWRALHGADRGLLAHELAELLPGTWPRGRGHAIASEPPQGSSGPWRN